MKKNEGRPSTSADLRRRAEEILKKDPAAIKRMRPGDVQELIHELQVQQIELELQNEELCRVQAELEESRNKYLGLYDFSPVGHLTLDEQGLICEANLTAADLLGAEKPGLIEKEFSRFLFPPDRDRFYTHRKKAISSGKIQTCELKVKKGEGEFFDVALRSIAVMDADGKFGRFCTTITDISEHKRVEEEQGRLVAAFESVGEAILITDSDGTIRHVNPAFERITGYTVAEIIGTDGRRLHNGELGDVLSREILEALDTGEIWRRQVSMKRKGGSVYDAEVTLAPVGDPSVKSMDCVAVIRDVTKRKRAEEALRESEQKYRVLFHGSPEGILVADIETGRFKYANPAISRMLGYTPEELIQMGVGDIHPEEALEHVYSEFQAQARGEKTLAPNIPCLRKDGTTVYADINTTKISIDGRDCNVGFFTDITERKRGEEKLKAERDKFQMLINGLTLTQIGIGIVGLDYKVRVQNQVLVDRFGDITGELCYEKYMGLKEPCDFCPMTKAIKNKRTESVELTAKDGRDYELVSAPLANPDGTIDKAIEVVRDITVRRRAEKALRKSEKKHRMLFEAMSQGVVYQNRQGKIVSANPAATEMLGLSLDDMLGRTSADPRWKAIHEDGSGFPGDTHPSMIALKTGKAVKDVRMGIFNPKANEYRWVNINAIPEFKPGEDKPGHVFMTIHDVTELKQAGDALRQSEERFRELFNNMSSGVAIYKARDKGSDFVFMGFNRAGERIDGVREADVIGKSVQEVFPGVKEFGFFEILQRVWNTGKPEHYPVTQYQDQRIAGWRENYVYKLPSGEVVAIYDDVTDRKQAEEKILTYQQQLQRLVAELSLAEERERRELAQRLHDSIGQLLAFSRMKLVSLQQQPGSPAETANVLDKVKKQIEKAVQHTRSLTFELSPPVLYELGFGDALEWLAEETEAQHDIRISYDGVEQSIPLTEDLRVILFQATRELLTNVIKHAQATQAKVILRRKGDQVQVEVADNGIGFDQEAIATRGEGGGFGLFNIRERINLCGGSLRIDSEPGGESRVTLTAPVQYEKRQTQETDDENQNPLGG